MAANGSSATPTSRELIDLLGPFWSAGRTAQALAVAPSALRTLCRDGALLGLTSSDGDMVYPVFQFEKTGDDIRVKPPLLTVLRTLRSFDPWTVAVLMHTPAPELHGRTPLDAARRKTPDDDLEGFARVVAREWAAGGPAE